MKYSVCAGCFRVKTPIRPQRREPSKRKNTIRYPVPTLLETFVRFLSITIIYRYNFLWI